MGGRPCLCGLRVTVGTIVGLIAAGRSTAEILGHYPYLEADDIREALAYSAHMPRCERTSRPTMPIVAYW